MHRILAAAVALSLSAGAASATSAPKPAPAAPKAAPAAPKAETAPKGEPVFPKGGTIGLVPPAGMAPAAAFQGFENPKTGASITVVELPPGSFAKFSKDFEPEALKTQGLLDARRESVRVAGSEGFLVSGRQVAGPTTVLRWMLVADTPRHTALVIAQAIKGDPAGEAAVRDALRTVAFREPPPIEEQMASLPFRLGARADFRPVRVMGGDSVLLTDGPKDMVEAAEQPLLIVASVAGGAPTEANREAFSRALVSRMAGLSDVKVERAQGFRQRNADWFEVVATAKEKSGKTVAVIQAIRFQGSGYIRTVGVTEAGQRDGVMPRFRQVIDGLETP